MASMRDIAREAQVSVTTVSRVLANDPDFQVTEQTRSRVFAAAKALAYVMKEPDHPYSPATPQKVLLGAVLAMTTEKYSDPFFDSILASAREESSKHGAYIQMTRNFNDLDDPAILEELCTSGLSGLIVMEELPCEVMQKLRDSIPQIIMIDQPDSRLNGVGYDHLDASSQIMTCLLERGYKRIAFISGGTPHTALDDSIRHLVYRESLRKQGIPYDPSLVKDCHWDLNVCAAQTRELMEMEERPDAIIAGSDSLASAILGVIYTMGYRCPRDIGVIGFNNLSLSAHLIPPLTTVNIPTDEIGKIAVQRLMEMISGRGGSVRKILVPSSIVLRDSLRKKV